MIVYYHNPDYLFGIHTSFLGEYKKTIETAILNPYIRCFQIYTSNRSFNKQKYDIDDIFEAKNILEKSGKKMFIHSSLLLNMCGSVDPNNLSAQKLEKYKELFCFDMDIGVVFGSGSVIHFGSCKDKDLGTILFVKNIKECLSMKTPEAKLFSKRLNISVDQFISKRLCILENSAGEGTKLGHKMQDIINILKSIDDSRVGLCLDTAHLFGYGEFDLRYHLKNFLDYINRENIIKYIKCFHFNDSKVDLGSKKDRHESLGHGMIFKDNLDVMNEFIEFFKNNKIYFIRESHNLCYEDDYEIILNYTKMCNKII